MKSKTARVLFGLTFILIFGAAAQAATFTSAASGDWATASTWTFSGTDADGIPDADDTVTITSPRVVTVSGAQSVHIIAVNTGGTMTLNAGAALTLDGTAGSDYSGAGTINGSGTFMTQGTTSIAPTANFTAPLVISGGTTIGLGTVAGAVTVLSGATLNTGNQDFTVTGDLTNSGTITKTSGSFNASGPNIINNGTITGGAFNFSGSGTQNLSGSGTLTADITILANSVTTLTSDVMIGNSVFPTTLAVNTGGTLAVGGNTLTLNRAAVSGAGAFTSAAGGKFRTQGASSIAVGASFIGSLEINSGTTTASGTVAGAVTVLSGATLNTGNQDFTVGGNLTNSGTITKSSGSFNASGPNILNNGTITGGAFNFSGTGAQNLSGTGTLTADITILANSVTTLTSDVMIGNSVFPTTLAVNPNGTLAVSGNTLTLNRVSVSGAGSFTSTASGKLRMQGTSSIAVSAGFTGSLEINSGTTTGSGAVAGALTVLSGATLNTVNQNFTAGGNLTNNGTITKSSGNYSASGSNIINNGTITGGGFIFNGGAQNLSGTGSISSDATILSGATVMLGSSHQLNTLAVNGGGTLGTATFTLFLNGAGTPLSGGGTISNVSITYNGSAAQTVQTAANVTYDQLGVDNPAGVTLSATKIISQQLRLVNGTLNSNSNLMLADNATIVRDHGTLAAAPTFMGTINVIYTGAANPLTTGNELPVTAATLKNLTINKTPGTSVNLNAAATVNGALTLTNGFLMTGANVLTVAGSGTATGAATSYILGSLTKQYTQVQPFTYPVGTANGYSPLNVNVTNVTATATLIVGVVQTVQPDVSGPEQTVALKRYWTLNKTGNLAATLQFNYQQVDVPAGSAESDLRLRRYTGGTSQTIPATVDPGANTITTPGPVADFSDWTAVALGPTAAEASLGGKVVTARNRPIAGATVILTDSEGKTVTGRTNAFGYFQFSGLAAGATYLLDVRQKQYSFLPQVISLTADLGEITITAQQPGGVDNKQEVTSDQ